MAKDIPKQSKTKRKQKQEPKHTQPKGKDKNEPKNSQKKKEKQHDQFDALLCVNDLQKQISEKLATVSNVYAQLSELEIGAEFAGHGARSKNVWDSCSSVGLKVMASLVIDAQNSIFDKQRQIFKQISSLQTQYTKIKDILEDTKCLNDLQIDTILSLVQKKIEAEKKMIEQLDQIVKKGNIVLDKPESLQL